MHPSAMAWAERTITAEMVAGRTVIEVGSRDVNGSVRPHIEGLGPAAYLGIDRTPGPKVDQVIDATILPRVYGVDRFGLVVSTEMLEHAADWRAALWAMAAICAPGGRLILTTRGPGFPYHCPPDCWRFTLPTIKAAMAALGLDTAELTADPDHPGLFCQAIRPAGSQPPPRRALDGLDAIPMIDAPGGSTVAESKPQTPQIPYQQASQIRQAAQELENAKRLGNEERVKAAEKTLRALGVDPTTSGVQAAGRALTDDLVKGRGQRQRETADATGADPAEVPGGGPDPQTPADRDEDQAGKVVPADATPSEPEPEPKRSSGRQTKGK